ncbi:MAG: hypothetical protein AAFX06_21380 [Planctomycetota bacterium]
MLRNVANQRFHVTAFGNNGTVSGIASQITCELAKDGAAAAALNQANPTEKGTTGRYVFDLLQAETDAYELDFRPITTANGVQLIGEPSSVIYTQAPASAGSSSLASTGGLFDGANIELFQDDDYSGVFAIVWDITKAGTDFTGVSGALFGAGQTPGSPTITPTTIAVSNLAVGSMRVTATFDKSGLQGTAGRYPYTLKALIGSSRHTIQQGTVTLSPTYVQFST